MNALTARVPEQPEAARFSVIETLRDGRPAEIRAFRPGDRAGLMIAVGDRSSSRSLRSRFFTVRRHFSQREIDSFTNVDFVRHVALVALLEEANGPAIIGAGRYFVGEARSAEVALAVIDDYQGLGVGTALVRALIALARAAELKSLVAHVLSDNAAMLNIFKKCGLPIEMHGDREVMHLTLALRAGAAARISDAPITQDGNLP